MTLRYRSVVGYMGAMRERRWRSPTNITNWLRSIESRGIVGYGLSTAIPIGLVRLAFRYVAPVALPEEEHKPANFETWSTISLNESGGNPSRDPSSRFRVVL